MTVIAAVYLPDSPLHVVSILCHVCQQLIAMGCTIWQDSRIAASVQVYSLSNKSLSISIVFLAAPRAVELTVIDD